MASTKKGSRKNEHRQLRVSDISNLMRALSDETRLKMVAIFLHADELCVYDMEDLLGVTQSKTSRHLRYLFGSGIVQDRRDGVWVYYSLRPELRLEFSEIFAPIERAWLGSEFRNIRQRLAKRSKQGAAVAGSIDVAGKAERQRSSRGARQAS